MPVTNQMLNACREEGCISVTVERKHYHVDGSRIKRSLRPSEWQTNPFNGALYVPRLGNDRIYNEAAALRFISARTNVPVPKLYACFEDNDAVYLVTEHVEGKAMADLTQDERRVVEAELERYIEILHGLTSNIWGGPTGLVIPPYRVMTASARSEWKMKPRKTDDLVFCHNDLSTHNIIVDPDTLKVNAIIDWEYAGFYPAEFEGEYFRRVGPSVAQDGEVDDVERLLDIMSENEIA